MAENVEMYLRSFIIFFSFIMTCSLLIFNHNKTTFDLICLFKKMKTYFSMASGQKIIPYNGNW